MKKKIALIPAAGRGSRMMGLTENNPKPMLPYEGKPIIGHTLDLLIKNDIEEVVIVVGYKKEKLIDYVLNFYKDKISIKFVEQLDLNGLAGAIKVGTDIIQDKDNKHLTIILGDIILHDKTVFELDGDFLGYKPVKDYSRWCMVDFKDDKIVFYDKPSVKPPTDSALMGVYGISDIGALNDSVSIVLSREETIGGEYQFSQVFNEYMKITRNEIQLKKILDFFDMGEIEDLTQTRKNITRHFNTIKKTDYGTIIKSSENSAKTKDEAHWYISLPQRVKMYTPHLVDINEDGSYELEFIGSTPVQELYIYDLVEKHVWFNFFKRLTQYFIETVKATNKKISKYDLHLVYIDKTIDRVNKIPNEFKKDEYVTINNIVYKNPIKHLNKIISKIDEEVISDFSANRNSAILHGDLFFGNMFYDIASESLKIIDPRGKFGDRVDNLGDIRYDVAKMNHSINGYYDFIVNGLYTLYEDSNGYHYSFYEGNQKVVKGLFDEMILKHYNKDEIDLLTGLLFLTMIPLHEENKNNQKMQFIQAVKFLNKFL